MEGQLLLEIRDHTVAFDGPTTQAWLPAGASLPVQQTTVLHLQIYHGREGYYLVCSSSNPSFGSGDTWHQSLEDTPAQAETQFGASLHRWQRVAV